MTEDHGETKGQDSSDAAVKADAAIPATPAALSDKELEKVAGGGYVMSGPVPGTQAGLRSTNGTGWVSSAQTSFGPR